MKIPIIFLGLISLCSAETSLTIYNSNLGVVRDTIPLNLQTGASVVHYDKATAQVLADSVVLRDPSGKIDFSILEQSYRNDPVSQGLLLKLNEGKVITFEKIYPDGTVKSIHGKIIRSGYAKGRTQSPVIEVDNKLQFSLPGQPLFPSLGDDSILRPTLSWQIDSAETSTFDAQLSYLSRGFSWEADYNIVAPEKGENVAITGWVTLNNNSGTEFKNTKVKLVAGDVNIIPEYGFSDSFAEGSIALSSSRMEKKEKVTEKAFDDFHLYSLPRLLNLKDKEQKQVEFLRASNVKAKKRYIYNPSPHFRYYGGSPQTNPLTGQKFPEDILIFWKFKNSKENGLAVPLPAGSVRFYRNDEADNNLEFVGENRIDHTATNEEVEVYTGNAFDLIGEKKVTNFDYKKANSYITESVEILLKNRSKEDKTITVREPLFRWSGWEITESSVPFEKINSNHIEADIALAPDEEKTISYTVKYSW